MKPPWAGAGGGGGGGGNPPGHGNKPHPKRHALSVGRELGGGSSGVGWEQRLRELGAAGELGGEWRSRSDEVSLLGEESARTTAA